MSVCLPAQYVRTRWAGMTAASTCLTQETLWSINQSERGSELFPVCFFLRRDAECHWIRRSKWLYEVEAYTILVFFGIFVSYHLNISLCSCVGWWHWLRGSMTHIADGLKESLWYRLLFYTVNCVVCAAKLTICVILCAQLTLYYKSCPSLTPPSVVLVGSRLRSYLTSLISAE